MIITKIFLMYRYNVVEFANSLMFNHIILTEKIIDSVQV